jgi:hypothetical protein
MGNDAHKPSCAFWLFLPWLTAVAIFVAYMTGLADRIFKPIPGVSDQIQQNMGWGMLLVTFLSSARWAYLRFTNQFSDAYVPTAKIIGMAILITIAQCCVALGVFFVGCLVVASKWH